MADASDTEPLTWLERLLAMAVRRSAVSGALADAGSRYIYGWAIWYSEYAAEHAFRPYLATALDQLGRCVAEADRRESGGRRG